MKKEYETPNVFLIKIDEYDVIRTSVEIDEFDTVDDPYDWIK